MADAAGKTTLIPHETAIKTREFIANDLAAWASFQPDNKSLDLQLGARRHLQDLPTCDHPNTK